MKPEIDIKEVPITIETAHQFFNKRQMSFIVKLKKKEYKEGFLNGMKMKLIASLLLFTSFCFGQSTIIAAGNQYETIGEVFTIMQQLDTIEKEVSLGVPKYEYPEQPKPIIKKKPKSFLEKLITFIKNLINKNK